MHQNVGRHDLGTVPSDMANKVLQYTATKTVAGAHSLASWRATVVNQSRYNRIKIARDEIASK